MQKYILTLLLTLNSVFICAMEVEEQQSFRCCSWRDYIPAWLRYKTTQLQLLHASRDALKSQLETPPLMRFHIPLYNNSESDEFLKYCYNLNPHEIPDFSSYLDHLGRSYFSFNPASHSMIHIYKKIDKDGYSVLGAILAAKNLSTQNKYVCMTLALGKGFNLTEKDRSLLNLELYEAISKNLIPLVHNDQTSYFFLLPYDVKKYIMEYCISLFKSDEKLYLFLEMGKKVSPSNIA